MSPLIIKNTFSIFYTIFVLPFINIICIIDLFIVLTGSWAYLFKQIGVFWFGGCLLFAFCHFDIFIILNFWFLLTHFWKLMQKIPFWVFLLLFLLPLLWRLNSFWFIFLRFLLFFRFFCILAFYISAILQFFAHILSSFSETTIPLFGPSPNIRWDSSFPLFLPDFYLFLLLFFCYIFPLLLQSFLIQKRTSHLLILIIAIFRYFFSRFS